MLLHNPSNLEQKLELIFRILYGMVLRFDTRTTFRIGAVAQLNIDGVLGVQSELLYSPQGAKFKNDHFDATYKLDYIVLPVLIKF